MKRNLSDESVQQPGKKQRIEEDGEENLHHRDLQHEFALLTTAEQVDAQISATQHDVEQLETCRHLLLARIAQLRDASAQQQ